MRHYAVLQIAYNESRIFVTKTKAPYMICVELFRPHEEFMQMTPQRWFKRTSISNLIKRHEKEVSKRVTVKAVNK